MEADRHSAARPANSGEGRACNVARVDGELLYVATENGIRCPCGVGPMADGQHCIFGDPLSTRMGGDTRMRQHQATKDDGNPLAWIVGRDTGLSSKTVWAVMMGVEKYLDHASPPYDPSDFGRVYRLLKIMPSWAGRMSEVADKYPKWKPLVDNWVELTALWEAESPTGPCHKMHNRMRELSGRL